MENTHQNTSSSSSSSSSSPSSQTPSSALRCSGITRPTQIVTAFPQGRSGSRGAKTLAEIECPLSLQVYVEPVQASCGHVFSRQAISQWLSFRAGSCPLCAQPIDAASLRPSDAIEQLVSAFQRAFDVQLPPPADVYYMVEHTRQDHQGGVSKDHPHQNKQPTLHPNQQPNQPPNQQHDRKKAGKNAAKDREEPSKSRRSKKQPGPSSPQPAFQAFAGQQVVAVAAHTQDDLVVQPGDLLEVQIPDGAMLYVAHADSPSNAGFIPIEKVSPLAQAGGSGAGPSAAAAADRLGRVFRVAIEWEKQTEREVSLKVGENVLVTQVGDDEFVYVESESGGGWVPAMILSE